MAGIADGYGRTAAREDRLKFDRARGIIDTS